MTLSYTKVKKPPVVVSFDSATQGKFQVSGYFEKETERLDLSWKTDWSNSTWNLTFQFAKSENSYNLSKISLFYELVDLPGIRCASNNRSLFSAAIGSYYSCQAEQNIVLNHFTPNPVTVKLTLSQLKVQAFRHGLEPEFNGISLLAVYRLSFTNNGRSVVIRFTILVVYYPCFQATNGSCFYC
ncbi:unnamed protein product [Schistosoma spindalis]|nr:unnamed protein product [Schistosoma spindale]